MATMKKIWQSELGKILISFIGLLLLLGSLTIVPILTYWAGEPVTVRIYDASENLRESDINPYVEPGLLGITEVDGTLLTGDLKATYDAGENFYSILDTSTVYAILDVNGIATIQELTLETPPDGAVYLEIETMYGTFDLERSEAYRDETGEWREFYDGVTIQMFDLIAAIESRYPDLRETLQDETLDVNLRIWNGRYVIVNP